MGQKSVTEKYITGNEFINMDDLDAVVKLLPSMSSEKLVNLILQQGYPLGDEDYIIIDYISDPMELLQLMETLAPLWRNVSLPSRIPSSIFARNIDNIKSENLNTIYQIFSGEKVDQGKVDKLSMEIQDTIHRLSKYYDININKRSAKVPNVPPNAPKSYIARQKYDEVAAAQIFRSKVRQPSILQQELDILRGTENNARNTSNFMHSQG